MVLGEQVEGIFTKGWRFVTSDANGIAETIQRENPDARLICHPVNGNIAVAEWFKREHMGSGDIEKLARTPIQARGGTWYRSFDWTDAEGNHIHGEPDQRLLDELRRLDNSKRKGKFSAARYVAEMERLEERAQGRIEARGLNGANREQINRAVRLFQKRIGQKPARIYVPRGVVRGSG